MKKTFVLLLGALLFLSASICKAQDSIRTRVGVGISLEPARLFIGGSGLAFSSIMTPVNFYLVIRLGSLRIEPEFGLSNSSSDTKSGTSNNSSSSSINRLGVGVHYSVVANSPLHIYFGPRVGWYFVSSISSQTSGSFSSRFESSETDFTIGGSLGCEYSLSEDLSLGGEAVITHVSFGNPETKQTPPPSSTSSRTASHYSTNTLFFLRWYF